MRSSRCRSRLVLTTVAMLAMGEPEPPRPLGRTTAQGTNGTSLGANHYQV
jgi:hypothetical protein